MPTNPPELSAHLGYLLRQVSNHVSHAFARKVAVKDVTVAEWVVLRVLHGKPPTSPSILAEELGMTRGAISKLADRLIGKTLASREPRPDDGRAQTLQLTTRGTRLVPELARLADQNEFECFAHLDSEDVRTLQRILKETIARLGITAMPIE